MEMVFFLVPIVIMYMYVFLWCFLSVKIAKNCQKWLYIGIDVFFPLRFKKLSQSAAKHATAVCTSGSLVSKQRFTQNFSVS